MSENKKKKKDGEKTFLLFCSVFFLLALGCIIFGVLLLAEWNGVGVSRFSVWSAVVTLSVWFGYVVTILLFAKGYGTFAKAMLSLYIFVLFCFIFIYVLQKTGFFQVFRDERLFREYLQKAGIWMPLLYILLQFLQVVVLPIPSIVSTIAGIALFGAIKTLIYSFIGILLGSFLAFFIGRKLGNKAVSWIVGKENLQKWQKKLKGKDNLFLSLMFLLPLFPDDILCFLAGLSTMTWGYFTAIILISRALALSATCFSVDFIPFTTWWGITLWCVLAIILTVIFIIIYKNLDKIQRRIDFLKTKRKKRK